MTLRVGINGFGRIGTLTARALLQKGGDEVTLALINGTSAPEDMALMLEYDSVHGKLPFAVEAEGNSLIADDKTIPVSQGRDPAKIDWAGHGVDIVLECTGAFKDPASCQPHLNQGAKKVLISAPGKSVDRTVVYGVNHETLTSEDTIVSNASCTTNALAPVAMVLEDAVGIERGYMTTIHAYTSDQRILDGKHKDTRRGRAAALSMVPTSTGAAAALGEVLPALKGRLDSSAIRVPTPNVSMIDLVFNAKRSTSVEALNASMVAATKGPLKGILATSSKPLVSIDFCTHPASAIFDLSLTQMVSDTLVRVAAWYDNEWGFSNRMIDTALAMHSA